MRLAAMGCLRKELVGLVENAEDDATVGTPRVVDRAGAPPDVVAGRASAIGVDERAFQHEALLEADMTVLRQPRPRLHPGDDRHAAGRVRVELLGPDTGERRGLPVDLGDVDVRRSPRSVDAHRAPLDRRLHVVWKQVTARFLEEERDPGGIGREVVVELDHCASMDGDWSVYIAPASLGRETG